MTLETFSNAAGNVISIDEIRHQLSVVRLRLVDLKEPIGSRRRPSMDTVFFITGGQFEAMVNGAVGILDAGDFLRVPEGGTYRFQDIGANRGAMVCHQFPRGTDLGFLRELALALPAYSTSLPRRGTPAHGRIYAIARRWGITLDSDAAA